MFTSLRHQYPAVEHIWTHLVNLASGPKSGFKNKSRFRAGFRQDFGLGSGSGFKMRAAYISAPTCTWSVCSCVQSCWNENYH